MKFIKLTLVKNTTELLLSSSFVYLLFCKLYSLDLLKLFLSLQRHLLYFGNQEACLLLAQWLEGGLLGHQLTHILLPRNRCLLKTTIMELITAATLLSVLICKTDAVNRLSLIHI